MFDSLVSAASGVSGAGAVGAWARIENAACARRLSAAADVLDRRYAADGSAERDQWIQDNYAAVAAEIAPAQNVSLGVAAHQLEVAVALRDRLPMVNAVFVTGAITYRLVAAIVSRTWLIRDPVALAGVDAALAARLPGWTTLSLQKLHVEVDYWVDRYDPAAVRRAENSARSRYVEVKDPKNGSGVAYLEATVFAHDGELIDQRLDAVAATVCDNDPRTRDQRRADAIAAVIAGAQTLACACGSDDCPATADTDTATAVGVVVHVVANRDTLDDATVAELDGDKPIEVIEADDPTLSGPAAAGPGCVLDNAAILPAPLVADKLAGAKHQPIVHPGDSAPERRYRPSAALAWFIRCRDLTCRFPGCDKPATVCDLDHTIPYPKGATQASNLKCLCRQHHSLKTFWGWRDRQHPDGTVEWLSPEGQRYTTYPGSRLLFPTLCRPTAPAVIDHTVKEVDDAARSLKMPRRKRTRAQDRANAIETERRANQPHVDERNKPPPF